MHYQNHQQRFTASETEQITEVVAKSRCLTFFVTENNHCITNGVFFFQKYKKDHWLQLELLRGQVIKLQKNIKRTNQMYYLKSSLQTCHDIFITIICYQDKMEKLKFRIFSLVQESPSDKVELSLFVIRLPCLFLGIFQFKLISFQTNIYHWKF